MQFNRKLAKIGKGKFASGYVESDGNIIIYLNSGGIQKKLLSQNDDVINLTNKEIISGKSEIIKVSESVFVQRILQKVAIRSSDK